MSEKTLFFAGAVALGITIAVHLAMNAKVGEIVGSPRAGNALFWLVGALAAAAIFVHSGHFNALSSAREVPGWLWLAGAMGASLVLGTAYLMPRLGVGPTTVGLILGQLLAGAVISHFGWLDSPVSAINPARLAGLALMAGGVVLVVR